jgi:drug/metabolite transporter (DMT)-like permease
VPRQWLGLLLGLAGVWFVVRHKVGLTGSLTGLAAIAVALAGISVGTLYQKRFCSHVDLRTGAVIQFAACATVYLPVVIALDSEPVRWTPEFAFALGWSCCRSARSVCSTGCCATAPLRTSHGCSFLSRP